MRDTTPAAEQVRLDAIRHMEPAERMRHAFDLSELMRTLALTRLRAAHPDCTERQLVEMLFATVHGRPISSRA